MADAVSRTTLKHRSYRSCRSSTVEVDYAQGTDSCHQPESVASLCPGSWIQAGRGRVVMKTLRAVTAAGEEEGEAAPSRERQTAALANGRYTRRIHLSFDPQQTVHHSPVALVSTALDHVPFERRRISSSAALARLPAHPPDQSPMSNQSPPKASWGGSPPVSRTTTRRSLRNH